LSIKNKFSLEKPLPHATGRRDHIAGMVSTDGLDHPTHGRLSKMLIKKVLVFTKMIPSGPTTLLS